MVDNELGTYAVIAVPDGGDGTGPATIVDLGGPGVPAGLLTQIDPADLPESLVEGRRLIAIGNVKGPEPVTEQCLAALADYLDAVLDVTAPLGSVGEDAVVGCALQDYADSYDRASAALVTHLLASEGATSYDVVGSSFAAARWQLTLPRLDADERPDSVTVVSALPLGSDLTAVLDWQATSADRVWATAACSDADCRRRFERLLDEPLVTAGLFVGSLTDATVAQVASELRAGVANDAGAVPDNDRARATDGAQGRLHEALSLLGRRYFRLNAAAHPRESLVEYFAAICRATDGPALDTGSGAGSDAGRAFRLTATRFHGLCLAIDGSPGLDTTGAPPDPTPCFVDLPADRLVPPSATLFAPSRMRNRLAAPDGRFDHGNLAVLRHVQTAEGFCPSYPAAAPRWRFTTEGLVPRLEVAVDDRLLLPQLDLDGTYILSDALLGDGDDITFASGGRLPPGDVDAYCLVGSITESDAVPGAGYVVAVGVDGAEPPRCVAVPGALRFESSGQAASVVEYLDCSSRRGAPCDLTWLRERLSYLDNGASAVPLVGSVWLDPDGG